MDESMLMKIINGLLGLIMLLLGWNLKAHKASHDKLTESHNNLALNVSENYAKKTDLNAARLETSDSLKRVYEKIEAVDQNFDRKLSALPEMIVKLLHK